MLIQGKWTLLFAILLNLLMLTNRVVANDATDPNCAFTLMKPQTGNFRVDSQAYTSIQDINPLTDTDSTHLFVHQSDPAITYHIATSRPKEGATGGTQNVTNTEVGKIREAFKDWGRVKIGSVVRGNRRSAIEFEEKGKVSPDSEGRYNLIDEKNVIYWSSDNTFFGRDMDFITDRSDCNDGILAVTLLTFDVTDPNQLKIDDADIALNGSLNEELTNRPRDYKWTTSGGFDQNDLLDRCYAGIQGVVTHEIGHLLGIGHSPRPNNSQVADDVTMWDGDSWSVYNFDDWDTMKDLSNDDIAAIQYMYGNPSATNSDDYPLHVPQVFQSIEEAAEFATASSFAQTILVSNDAHLVDPRDRASTTGITVVVSAKDRLKIDSSVTISCQTRAKLEIQGALIADGAVFESTTSSEKWGGIVLKNQMASEITNCTLRNATTAITCDNPTGTVTIQNCTYENNDQNTSGCDAAAPAPMRADSIPSTNRLLLNYPNPSNPETWIPYQLASDADVQISIYDTEGGLVRRLNLGHRKAGYYTDPSQSAYWDGRNEHGESVASGAYFYTLTAGDYTETRKMLILK